MKRVATLIHASLVNWLYREDRKIKSEDWGGSTIELCFARPHLGVDDQAGRSLDT
jgi:hypothetical protein